MFSPLPEDKDLDSFSPFPNDKILDQSKLKAFSDNNINVT